MRRQILFSLLIGIGIAVAPAARMDAQQSPFSPSLSSGLAWRMLGPFRGGRVAAVSGVPGRRHEFYSGAVNGGVWKSIDAGRTWAPIFDSQPVASIGAIAVAPSNPDVVYVGSGESTLRDSAGYGNGMYKSTDGGKTWTHIGLDDTHHIGKVAIDWKNPDVVFVAAIGHFYGPHPDRGVYRSKDGGRTWQKVLFKNDSVGAVDVAIDPANSQVIYASLWNTRRPPWYVYAPSNGPGGGIYKSTDGGTTWTQLTKGLPVDGVGRSGIAIAPSNPKRIYAIVDAKEGGLFRSDDAGASWTLMAGGQPAAAAGQPGAPPSAAGLWGRGWYFEKITVDPKNPDVVFVPNVAVYRSKDGGRTWATVRGSPGGDDYHQLWISPDDSNVMIVASDQGAVVTLDGTLDVPTWSSWLNQPTAQLYHVSADYRFPYWVTGAQQDSGAVAVRTRGKFAGISMRDWEPVCAGGESGYTAADPLHPSTLFGGSVEKCNLDTNSDVTNIPPPAGPEPARRDWTQPLVFSKADSHALYYADQYLYKTVDGGSTWRRISDDLTRPDPGIPPNLDEASAALSDRNGKRGVIYTIAPSPVLLPLIWIGTDDGYIQVSTNDGREWQNVTPPAVASWSRVTMIDASHFDFNEAYAAVDRHQLEDFRPHVYRTRDLGKTWQEITRGLPADGYVHTIKEDPQRRGLLFAGTERGVHVSFDDGDSWQTLQLNLPVTSMRDLEVHGNDLIVATHGRGFWIIDDISVLRQLNDEVARAAAYLFRPAEAVALPATSDNGTPTQKDEPQAPNPPNGAFIDYYLKTAASGPVTIEILDASGQAIASASSAAGTPGAASAAFPPNVSPLWRAPAEPLSAAAGLHRWVWTPGAGGRGGGARGGGGRAGGGGAGRAGGRGGAAATGAFSVRLTVDGQTYSQPLIVRPDPR